MNELVLIDQSDPAITVLTMNRPDKRNALSIDLIEQLTTAVIDASKDRNRRVIIIRGAGPSFCAGLDLKEASDPSKAHQSAEALAKMYEAIGTSPLITIAQAQGNAIGGGAGLLAACDFVVAADDLQIGYPEVRRGLVAALVTALLRRKFSENVVRQLVLLGQTMPVTRARGLVEATAPLEVLADAAMQFARTAIQGAPGAIARSKRLLDQLSPRTLHEDLKLALEFHLQARESAEAAEGMAAFFGEAPAELGA